MMGEEPLKGQLEAERNLPMEGSPAETKQMTILHVEDDSALAQLVRVAFERLGFRGELVQAVLVREAVAILNTRRRTKEPLDLILVDMQLPDGNGLEVLRKVKASPTWCMTPVIVLSAETSPDLINEAYALGSNCYLPKYDKKKGIFGAVQALYQCWVEGALLPQPSFVDLVQEALAGGIGLRARIARFYLGLARASAADPEQEKFWVERSLTEGNKSNLLAFFQGQISDRDIPPHISDKTLEMQRRIDKALKTAEERLAGRPDPAPEEICTWVLDLVDASDEEVLAEDFGALFPKSPAVTTALKAQAAGQLKELADYVLNRAQEPELHRRAEAILGFADRLNALGPP
jgi:CheY-like chemotaxis protein